MAKYIDPEQNETAALLALANFDDATLLDIGCGEGRFCQRFASRTALTIGLDIGVETLISARQQRADIYYVAASASHIPFRSGYFDIALFGWSL